MTARKSNTRARLRKIKNHYQQQLQQLKEEFGDQLATFEHSLQQQLYGQAFYHEALMNLLTSEDEPDSDTLIGAIIFQRWLNSTGREITLNMARYRTRQLK